MAGISVDSKTSSSVTLYVSELDTSWADGERTVYWYLGSAGGGIPTPSAYYKADTGSLSDGVSSGGSVTFTGLSASTQYGIYCEIYHGSTLLTENGLQGYVTTDYEDSSGDTEQTWALIKGDLGSVSVDSNAWLMDLSFYSYHMHRYSVKFTDDGTGSVGIINPGRDDICCYVSTGMTYDNVTGIPNLTVAEIESSSSKITLTFDTQAYLPYYIWIREKNGNRSTSTFSLAVSLSVDSMAIWDWYSSNGTAADDDTYNAYRAVVNQTATTNFSHDVWNDMVDKVKAISDEVVGWWDSDYASYDNTKAIVNSDGEYVLTAVMFNSLRNNIEIAGNSYLGLDKIPDGYADGEIPHPVYSKDDTAELPLKTVYGHYFLTLAEYINECIYNL